MWSSGIQKLCPLALLVLIGCVASCVGANGNRTTYEYLPSVNMVDMPSVKAQERPMRSPVPGTMPRGFTPYPYGKDEGDRAGQELKNPLPRITANFQRGEKLFNTYCIPCHGSMGKGDGSIVPKFPRPPSLHSDKVRNWSDGRIYHVISMGQNLMPSYATKIDPQDRWAVVLYVRALQRAGHPTKEDLESFKQRVVGKGQA